MTTEQPALKMARNCIVKFAQPMDADEAQERMRLMDDPAEVLAHAAKHGNTEWALMIGAQTMFTNLPFAPWKRYPLADLEVVAPSIELVATEFCKGLLAEIGEKNFKTLQRRNKKDRPDRICYSGDYCDSNLTMQNAFIVCGLDPLDTGTPDTENPLMSRECELVLAAAWMLAKKANFDTAKIEEHRPR